MLHTLLLTVTAFAATAVAIYILRPLCLKIGLVDHPDDVRKHHSTPIPLCGGLGIVAGIFIALLFADHDLRAIGWPFLVALLPLLIVGLWDDFAETSARVRIGAQIVSALLIVYMGYVVILHVGDIIEPGHVLNLGAWAVPLTVFSIVGIINGVNMLDGLDGLAGGVVFIALGWFATAAFIQGSGGEAVLILILMGAVAGFLAFNLRYSGRGRAVVFLGDTGSTVLGFALGWLSIRLSQGHADALPPMAVVWVIGVPLLDTLTQIVRRLAQGRHPMSPDRNHLHHLLLRAGLSEAQTIAALFVASWLFGAIGVGAWRFGVPMYVLFWGSLATYGAYLGVVTWGDWFRKPKGGDAAN
jgi:UDP-GlcNAc:undecaprenyl-phosphate GlcNAc-1-phosphate transferase